MVYGLSSLIFGEILMTDHTLDAEMIAPVSGMSSAERPSWERPKLQKLDFSEAEVNTASNFDGNIGFS